jgi:hypothetical protein
VRDFELDCPVDAVAIEANNLPGSRGPEPLAVYVSFIPTPVAVWAHAAVVQQVAFWVAWYSAVAIESKYYGPSGSGK